MAHTIGMTNIMALALASLLFLPIMYAFMFIPLMIMTTHGMDRSKDLLGIVGFISGSAGAWIASLINTYLK